MIFWQTNKNKGDVNNTIPTKPLVVEASSLDVHVGRLEIRQFPNDDKPPRLGFGVEVLLDGMPIDNILSLTLDIHPQRIITATMTVMA